MVRSSVLRPRHLAPGDTVAVLSPSWGGPHSFPHVFNHGLDVLRGWGLEVREYPSTRMSPDLLLRDPALRADDVNRAFGDPSVRAVIASIGGDDSIRLLPYLDKAVIASNPKILMGYSDTTTLLVAARSLGLVTFHGPSIMSGLSQAEALSPTFSSHVRQMLFEPTNSHTYQPYRAYSEGYPTWSDPANVGLVNAPTPDEGWRVLQGSGRVRGELLGGCLEVLDRMRGTWAFPAGEEWTGRLLFFEPSEDKPTPEQVARILRSFGVMGVFDRIAGVLVGRPRDHDAAERTAFEAAITAAVADEFRRPDLPIVANLDFGHTDPQWVLPIGVEAELDVNARALRLTEPWLL